MPTTLPTTDSPSAAAFVGDDPVVRTELESRIEAKQFAILWHPLLSDIAAAADQRIAAQRCVEHFTSMLPDHTVRLGWGVSSSKKPAFTCSLHHLLDSRLGWLGRDNSVYQSLATAFEKQTTDDPPIRWESASLVFAVRRDSLEEAAMLWIRPPQDQNDELRRFAQTVPPEVLQTLAAVFFSRPLSGWWGKVIEVCLKWWLRRASIGIATLLLIAVSCIPAAYRIDASATVTAMNSRRVAAPIDATLLIAHVRPGDRVRAGDPLFELDGRPLRIELESLTAEIDEAGKEEDIALAGGEIAQSQLAGLKRQTLTRRRDLITNRIDQLIVSSPIDGVVIQGDLHHSLGSPMEIGQTLLEIAPSDSVEIELEIPEVEIGYVDNATPVRLWFPAIGQSQLTTSVSVVYPSATIREEQNVFIAKTPIPESKYTDQLRVGMRGEALLMGPSRPWIWKWIRLPIRRMGWVMGW